MPFPRYDMSGRQQWSGCELSTCLCERACLVCPLLERVHWSVHQTFAWPMFGDAFADKATVGIRFLSFQNSSHPLCCNWDPVSGWLIQVWWPLLVIKHFYDTVTGRCFSQLVSWSLVPVLSLSLQRVGGRRTCVKHESWLPELKISVFPTTYVNMHWWRIQWPKLFWCPELEFAELGRNCWEQHESGDGEEAYT